MQEFSNNYYNTVRSSLVPNVIHMAHNCHRIEPGTRKISQGNWILNYAVENCGTFRAGPKMQNMVPRQNRTAHIYPPGLSFWEDMPEAAVRNSCWVIFTGGSEIGMESMITKGYDFLEVLDPEAVIGEILMEGVREAVASDENGFIEACICLYRIARALSSLIPGVEPYQKILSPTNELSGNFEQDWLRRARSNLLRDITVNLDIPRVAELMFCSPSTFSHKYKQLAGESPGQTLQKKRVEAASILVRSGLPLKDVATRTGFHDEFHLSKVFKRLTGVTPSNYRQMAKI